MKLFKYSLLLAVLLGVSGFMASCSDDDGPKGAGDATIGFAQPTTESGYYEYKETAGLIKIPVVFTGEPKSYPIVYNVSATLETAAGDDATLADVMLFTQSEGIRYYGDDKRPAPVEFTLIDNDYINESRFLTLTITSASGATISNASVTIEIKDNDNNPYDKLMGDWIFSGKNYSTGAITTFDVQISGGYTAEEEAANADKVLVCWGFGAVAREEGIPSSYVYPKQPTWFINFDFDSETLSIVAGKAMADIWSFTGIDEDCIVKSVTRLPGSTVNDTRTQIKGTWSEDLKTLTFEAGYSFLSAVYGAESGEYKGIWYGYYDIVMTKKP